MPATSLGDKALSQGSADTSERRGFFKSFMTVAGLIVNTRAVSRMPRPLRRRSMLCGVISGQRPVSAGSSRHDCGTPSGWWPRSCGFPVSVFPPLMTCSL